MIKIINRWIVRKDYLIPYTLILLLATVGTLGIFTCGYCQETGQTHEYVKEPISEQEDAIENDFCYVIGPGDVLDISIWQHPDLNREIVVRPDGKTSFPIVGEIQAAKLTPSELSISLKQKLSYYIRDPQVTVTVCGSNSKKVFVLGEVKQPGVYLFTGEMTALEAIAMAGGPNEDADRNAARIVRIEDGEEKTIFIKVKDITQQGEKDKDIPLKPNDIVFVPESFF